MLRRFLSPLKGLWTLRFFILAPLLLAGTVAVVSAQDVRFFRVGTGSTAGTYFPVGGIIASAISSPPGSRSCERGGSCGVPGLVAVAQSTRGSVDNVRQMRDGSLESGFSQSDVAFWAFNGEEIFEEEGAVTNLRAIANLYPRDDPPGGALRRRDRNGDRHQGQAYLPGPQGLRHTGSMRCWCWRPSA